MTDRRVTSARPVFIARTINMEQLMAKIDAQAKLADALAASLDAANKKAQEAGVKRKAVLPGFPGHRARCACALCAKQRRAAQELIDRTRVIRDAQAAAAAAPPVIN